MGVPEHTGAVSRRLYLLRHAKSSWDEPGLPDRDRPLAPRGERAARRMGAHLRSIGLRVPLVLCSPARRTRDTWSIVGEGIGGSVGGEPEVRYEPVVYAAAVADLLELLTALPDLEAVLLVGHNPGLEDLARAVDDNAVGAKLPTGTFVTVEFDKPWTGFVPARSHLTALVRPKDLARS